jgi:hypothetical protein
VGKPAKAENARFRDFGRSLAGARDAAAVVEALDRETPALAEAVDPAILSRIRAELVRQMEDGSGEVPELERAVAETLVGLVEAGARIADWSVPGEGFGVLAPGLEALYGQGREALAACGEAATAERLHEWRKRVKDHWYHMRLLAPAWPGGLDARVAELKALSDLLGNDHDLAVLRQRLSEDPGLAAAGGGALDGPLAGRQAALQAEALALGRRLYAEKPKAFRKRLGAYWAAWAVPTD